MANQSQILYEEYEGGTVLYINNPGHMTKMAVMPIHGKNPSKIFFCGTGSIRRGNQCVYKISRSHDRDDRHPHI